MMIFITNFNSIKVRLELGVRADLNTDISHFNSIKVRLEPFNREEAQKQRDISIP